MDKDSICQGGQISFTNTSVTTVQNGINPSYYWSYSDGLSDVTKNTVHTFTLPGIYKIMLAVKDFVPCYDTTYHLIEVDSFPYMNFILSDSVFCEGKGIVFDAIYLHEGLTSMEWYFGDGEGNFIYNRNPVTHAYDAPGIFTIKLTNKYRFCNDTSFTNTIRVKSYPAINIGRDTSICPNSSTPVSAYDYINAANPGASWLWNTGATTPGISIFSPGIYSATVTIDGCSTTDSMEVLKDCYIDIPNVFTPNGDGVNDYFFPRQLLTSGATAFSMQIFDRWGVLLFETTNTNGRGWDGKFNNIPQPEGVYIYLINVSFKNGVTEKFKGNVTLLR
jgi:gliding motility-associated-like protein